MVQLSSLLTIAVGGVTAAAALYSATPADALPPLRPLQSTVASGAALIIQVPGADARRAGRGDAATPRRRGGRRGEGRGGDDSRIAALPAGAVRLSYGEHADQRILLWPHAGAAAARGRPLAIHVHGGGWAHGAPEMVKALPQWFASHDWAFASVGYRLLPDAPVEEQARDVGRAIAALRREAASRGYDASRILLMGHSAGAHLTALVATDPQYAGDAFASIRGAMPVDGACYDVARQIAASSFMARRMYIPAFGSEVGRQRALSPIAHVGGGDVADWLILFDEGRDDAVTQSQALSAALSRSGSASVAMGLAVEGRSTLARHGAMIQTLGTPGYPGNAAVERLMARVSASR